MKIMFLFSGLTWAECTVRCPEGIVPACHNSVDTVTVSGPAEAITQFVAQLKEEGVFAKEVKSAGVAFHSYFMEKTAPALKAALEKVSCKDTFPHLSSTYYDAEVGVLKTFVSIKISIGPYFREESEYCTGIV